MPEIPEGAKTPTDHKKKKKPKKEAMRHEWKGETYTLVSPEILDDADVLEAFDNRQVSVALRLLLGEKEYARLKRNLADDGRTKASDLAEFFTSLAEEIPDVKN
ncbi:hypothetical protein K8P10_001989 [Leucobacter sp. Psy1]|uniref:hypothetical protein n=1 Tax=Leucobacter sp. Psy1 TaxID=2875729 RepID=UPI001CD40CE4|nr:hypothetical protein [Leucobacter sp. Psy1]UBH06478.1 hypothetical protein K8P10_001989 [Leucobacter sp. Psy1]